MNFKKIFSRKFFPLRISVFAAAAVILLILNYKYSTFLKESFLTYDNGMKTPVTFPYSSISDGNREFIFESTIQKNALAPSSIRIIPDDGVTEIKLNGNILPLNIVEPGKLFNWDVGFVYPVGNFLIDGNNKLEIKIRNNGGKFGLIINPTFYDFKYSLITFFLWLFIIFGLLEILQFFKMKISRRLLLLILVAVAVRVFYLSVTNWDVRGHDVTAHVDYVKYIAVNNKIPASSEGWAFYHPALYYVLSAVVYKISYALGMINPDSIYRNLQFFSLIIDLGVLLIGFLILKRYMNRLPLESSASLSVFARGRTFKIKRIIEKKIGSVNIFLILFGLFALWPSHVIHSVRIGNDILVYLFYLMTIYFLILWEDKKKNLYLYLSLASTAFAMFTKTSSLILMAIIYFLFLIKFIQDSARLKNIFHYIKKLSIVTGAFVIILAIVFGNSVYTILTSKKNGNILVQNSSGISSGLYVGNEAKNYYYFDTKDFLTNPYTSPWQDTGGRQYFWNYLFKTSLFGEFNYNTIFSRDLAECISLIFVLMLIYGLAGFFLLNKEKLLKHKILFLSIVLLLLFAALFRMMIPASCSNDFRYILPILISTPVFYILSMIEFKRRGFLKLFYSGYIMAFSFMLLSVIFIFSI